LSVFNKEEEEEDDDYIPKMVADTSIVTIND